MPIEYLKQQVIDLQDRLTFQEDMLQSLNQTVVDQDKAICVLNIQLKRWESRFNDMAYAIDSSDSPISEPPPPHY
ncbi:MAG: putative coiled-coil protein SlyX [Candidatus Endobugula sp.]|jgi:uncharacterized coiled-coil protein SlyX